MLYRANNVALADKAQRLSELACAGEAFEEQRALMAQLGASRRIAAVRPLVRSWACSVSVRKPKRRWFSFLVSRSAEDPETAERAQTAGEALRALTQLWSSAAPHQYNQLDQEVRGTYGSPNAEAPWRLLRPDSALEALPDYGATRAMGLGVLSFHLSGYVREAALRELAREPLHVSLPFLLVRANDWVWQVRSVAHARLLLVDESDVELLAPLLELVQQLAAQGRREPGAVEHLLNLLRTTRGLAAIQRSWSATAPSLRRAAMRFSWEESVDRDPVLRAAMDNDDPQLRRWVVQVLSASDSPRSAVRLRALARDPVPMVATAALDALENSLELEDVALLKELRCASSPGLQHTARFLLEKHFAEHAHREVYLQLLASDNERSRDVAAIGLPATGESEDARLLLAARRGARSKVRQRLLSAAFALDPQTSREAVLEDLCHELRGVSKAARGLLSSRVLESDAPALLELLQNAQPHVRGNALLLSARTSHWRGLPAILRSMSDAAEKNAETANLLLESWFARHFHGIYRAVEPTQTQELEVRAEMTACKGVLGLSQRERLERALVRA